jgi:hypothetical protein
MANPEHLQILMQGVETWNQWRSKNRDIKPDLTSVCLAGTDLSEADLSETAREYHRNRKLRDALIPLILLSVKESLKSSI